MLHCPMRQIWHNRMRQIWLKMHRDHETDMAHGVPILSSVLSVILNTL
jgi:hypothetical protein